MSADPSRGAESAPAPWLTLARDAPWMVALFVGTLLTIGRTMGTSPTIWEDTLIENLSLSDCLQHDNCTAVGVGATVGIFHSAGYLHWRALLYAVGIYADGTFRALLVMNALGVVLATLAARRLGGRFAAAMAALLMATSVGIPTQLNVITDLAPVPFLGAVFLLLALTAVERPSLGVTTLLGCVGGVAVNFYATGALLGPSAVWVALLLPLPAKQRWLHAAVAAGAFAVSTFAISPMTWVTDFQILTRADRVGNGQSIERHLLFNLPMAKLSALAVATWVVSLLPRSPLRRPLAVPAAILLPLVVPFGLGSWTGRIDPQGKYFAHVIGAVAVAISVGFVTLARSLWRWASTRPEPFAPGSLPAYTVATLRQAFACGAVVVSGLAVGSLTKAVDPFRRETEGDYHALVHHHVEDLMFRLGSSHRGFTYAVMALDVLGLTLVAQRLGGRRTAAVAALMIAATLLSAVTVDSGVVPFLGMLFVGVAVMAAQRPQLYMSAALGASAGVLATQHAPAYLCGLSALLVAARMPRLRWAHVALVAATFAAAVYALKPPGWFDTVVNQVFHPYIVGFVTPWRGFDDLPVQLTLVATVVWVVAMVARPSLRSQLLAPGAVVLPLLLNLVPRALMIGWIQPRDQYCGHGVGAAVLCLAVVVVDAVGYLLARLGALLTRGVLDSTRKQVIRLWDLLDALVPYAAAVVIASGAASIDQYRNDPSLRYQVFTFHDLDSVAQVLGRTRHWSWARAAVNLKAMDEIVHRAALHWITSWPAHGEDNPYERAYLVRIPNNQIRLPFPPNLVPTTSSRGNTTVAVLGCSWINWQSFRVCVRNNGEVDETCTDSLIPAESDGHLVYANGVPGMPHTDPSHPLARQTLTLHFPLHPTAQCPDEWVSMPHVARVCPGRIVGIDGATSLIREDGRSARLHFDPAAGQAPHEIAIAWELGGPECWNEYRGSPPFFVEGEPQAVELLDQVMGPLQPPSLRRSLW